MHPQHQGRDRSGRLHSLSRLALFAAPALIAGALVINAALPTVAHSQTGGRVTGAPKVVAQSAQKPKLLKAPAQVAMPAPPPIEYVPGMEEPLVAMGPVDEGETKALRIALKEFHDAPLRGGPNSDYEDYAKPLLSFIEAHPKSNWNVALYTDMGLGYYHAGYYSRAFDELSKAWELGRNVTSSPQARLLVDRAVGELAEMHARVGHDEELDALLKQLVGKRDIGGPATMLIQGAREGLWAFRNNPGEAYLCGPRALKNVLMTLKASPQQIQVAEEARSGRHGFSLTQLAALADKTKLKYTLIRRKPGEPIPVPSIVNWKVHHYAAIVASEGGKYRVIDPTFVNEGTMLTARAIDEESSGYFLVPSQARAPRDEWRTVAANSAEAKAVYGMGTTSNSKNEATGCGEKTAHDTPAIPAAPVPGVPTPGKQSTGLDTAVSQGMCTASAHAMVVNLHLQDTPVGYRPQKGPSAQIMLMYNAGDVTQPATFSFSNIGPKWTISGMSYIQDDPVNLGANVMHVQASGGGYVMEGAYNAQFQTWQTETQDGSAIYRIPGSGALTRYEHRFNDGHLEIYSLSDNATTYPRKIFLTSVVDPQGNTLTYNYDAQFRLTSITDAMGRSTTFTYGLSASPLLVTQVTDPFGRAAQLTYDTSGRLASITDPIGITSSFTYSSSGILYQGGSSLNTNFITQLTTPYGTSNFSGYGPVSQFYSDPNTGQQQTAVNTRFLTMTDPMGYSEFLYFYQNPNITPANEPANALPTNFGAWSDQGYLQWRNTYFWGKHAFALGVTTDASGNVTSEDFSKATIYHWYHDWSNIQLTSRAIGSIKKPLENRLWFHYVSQPVRYYNGSFDSPQFIARVLDDGTTQQSSAGYTSFWNLNTYQDAKGRYTVINYQPNNIDVNSVWRNKLNPASNCGGCYWQLAGFTWNSIHRPLTHTDESGKVWTYTWNTAGQLTSVKDPNTQTTTYNYDSVGRLSSVVNANGQTQASYTYDSADRVATYTDSEGYVLAYAYDNLDRITSITYPDGTTDLYDYNFQSGPNASTPSLELRKHTDRLGRVTTYDYDADRRLISVTEPTSGAATRTTSYDYYEDGTLKNLTDANGNVTHWEIDLESRPISKTYAFGTASAQTETYAYENTTSRLHSITDALGQVKTFTYDIDDRVKGITYTNTVNPTPNVTFTWDNLIEHVNSMTDGLGTTNFTYGAPGVLGALKLASVIGPFTNNTISLTYDNLGRLAARTIAGGNETFGYDLIGRLSSHGTPSGTFNYTYLGQTGQTASRSVTNGTVTVSTNWGYDTNTNDRRLISIANSGVTRSYTLGYGSGPVNPYDIMSITDTAATGHPFASQGHNYSYDLVDRLLTATSATPGNYAYGYDNLDNATSVTDPAFGSTAPTYNALNQVQAFNTNTYSYDANGNTASDGLTKNYKWDAENRLVEIDYIGSTAKSQFSYDGLGRRTVDIETDAVGNVTTTRFLWCGSRICQTRNGTDVVQSRILKEGEYNAVSAQKAVYMPDQLGSVRDVLDATTGNLLASLDYSPYGKVTQSNGSFAPFYQYAGLMYHPQSSLLFSATRALDQSQHWLNRDSIREAGGWNQYSYADDSPSNYSDPSGKCPWCIGAVIGGVSGVFGLHATNPDASWGAYIQAFGAGAVTGGLFAGIPVQLGFTSGSLLGGLGGLAGDIIGQLIGGKTLQCLNAGEVVAQTVLGAATGGLGAGIGAGLESELEGFGAFGQDIGEKFATSISGLLQFMGNTILPERDGGYFPNPH